MTSARAFEFYLRVGRARQSARRQQCRRHVCEGETASLRDPSEGASWFFFAPPKVGDALGQFNYAVALTKGIGVEIDLAQSREHGTGAPRISGHYPSQARLGYCYAKGLGVANDPIEAFVGCFREPSRGRPCHDRTRGPREIDARQPESDSATTALAMDGDI